MKRRYGREAETRIWHPLNALRAPICGSDAHLSTYLAMEAKVIESGFPRDEKGYPIRNICEACRHLTGYPSYPT